MHQPNELLIVGGVGDASLAGVGVKIGVAEFDTYHRGEFAFLAKLKGQVHCKLEQLRPQVSQINGVLCKGTLGRDGLLLVVRYNRAIVNAIGSLPDRTAVFAQELLHEANGHARQGADFTNPRTGKEPKGLRPDLRNFTHR